MRDGFVQVLKKSSHAVFEFTIIFLGRIWIKSHEFDGHVQSLLKLAHSRLLVNVALATSSMTELVDLDN